MINTQLAPQPVLKGESHMPTHLVNLDALIQREDFESGPNAVGEQSDQLSFNLTQLKRDQMFFKTLRKPDFQRDTTNWSPETIVEFVQSFLDGELIPSLILWHSSQTNKLFIIDGAHRISALIAWVNDDYGDGSISREFFQHKQFPAQIKLANMTRHLMAEKIGSYASLYEAGMNLTDKTDPVVARRAFAISNRQPHIQRVKGDAEIAEKSFVKINAKPAMIDPVELDVIQARKKPNAIATRALMRAGRGYQYWGKFPRAAEVTELAHEVYELLFGQIVELGTQSADVPRAGQPYSQEAFRMILDLVNLFNGVTDSMWQQSKIEKQKKAKKPVDELPDDVDGTDTLNYLRKVKEVAQLATDYDYDGSLGLDQAVYSYGKGGKFHTTAFLASLKFAQELASHNKCKQFTKVRRDFEEFLVRHKSFINDLGHSKGSRLRALDSFLTMYRTIMNALRDGITDDAGIMLRLNEQESLKGHLKEEIGGNGKAPKRFTKAIEAAANVREKLETRGRCKICGARLPEYARSKDHKVDKKYGGRGTLENLQYAHTFCNQSKDGLRAMGMEVS